MGVAPSNGECEHCPPMEEEAQQFLIDYEGAAPSRKHNTTYCNAYYCVSFFLLSYVWILIRMDARLASTEIGERTRSRQCTRSVSCHSSSPFTIHLLPRALLWVHFWAELVVSH